MCWQVRQVQKAAPVPLLHAREPRRWFTERESIARPVLEAQLEPPPR